MANLVQLSNDLEFVPKQQLIQMSQDPNTTYPSFLVLSEIQRRTQMEKMYAAQQPKPETTVAEELIAEFSGGQGLGAMAQPPSTLNAFQLGGTEDMAPPSPMQMMASGGKTGYAEGQITGSYGGYNLDAYPTQEELVEAKRKQDELIASGKLTAENKGFFEERYTMEDGSIDYATAALDGIDAITTAALVIPLAGFGIKTGVTALTATGRGLLGAYRAGKFKPAIEGSKKLFQKTYTRPNPAYKDAVPYGGKMINPTTGAEVSQRIFSPTRATFSGLGVAPFLGQMGYAAFTGSDEADIDPLRVDTENENAKNKISNDLITGELNANNQDKGLFGRFKDFAKSPDNADLLIALGGAIGSARSPAELSSNISNAYFGLKNAADEKQYRGLQGKLIDAQIKNIETSIAGLPLKELQTSAQLIQDGLEAGTVDREKGIQMLETIFARIQMLQKLTETGLPTEDEDPLTKYKI